MEYSLGIRFSNMHSIFFLANFSFSLLSPSSPFSLSVSFLSFSHLRHGGREEEEESFAEPQYSQIL